MKITVSSWVIPEIVTPRVTKAHWVDIYILNNLSHEMPTQMWDRCTRYQNYIFHIWKQWRLIIVTMTRHIKFGTNAYFLVKTIPVTYWDIVFIRLALFGFVLILYWFLVFLLTCWQELLRLIGLIYILSITYPMKCPPKCGTDAPNIKITFFISESNEG